ncbi:ABC transporter permease subunit [Sneathiella chungangensis]|uniref:ABC transporter permease subunit n=1 Tax=Sneathiella chungangensis TaxID=1418234 RepID=A0A845M636_9PROT|nr:ABC transporter permease [Sneathiella chungangensis]MZR20793.1 ABC transporter permease subunit [Sneathiella chungangensis]
MTDAVQPQVIPSWRRLYDGKVIPVATVLIALLILWLAGAVYMNSPQLIDQYKRGNVEWTFGKLVRDSWSMERPILPAPQQIVVELDKTVLDKKITSKRSLVYHAWVTLSSTLLGFAFGTILGILLAVGIVHIQTLDRSLMPWIIASQTVPILAIAPMIIVVLGNIGLTGLVPKALISMYLCFFPITIGMVKGLRSPDVLQLDLMKTYSASAAQVFWKLRIPASIPFLFTSLKVAIAISLVGAIVAELPTGAIEGLGARLLAGSYYGQTIQIWSALTVASLLGMLLVWAVALSEKLVLSRMGGQAA